MKLEDLDQIAPLFGPAVFVSDDGSVQDSPLRAKMPELARAMQVENALLREVVEAARCFAYGLAGIEKKCMGEESELRYEAFRKTLRRFDEHAKREGK